MNIVIHRQSPVHVHPEIGQPYPWLIDSHGARYWIQRGGPDWGYELLPDRLADAPRPIDGFFTYGDIREWAAQ